MVDDQAKALKFYTETLGFVLKVDVPTGEYRWLTVVSPDASEGTQLLLEPMGFAPARVYQKALFDAGIPLTQFGCEGLSSRVADGRVFLGWIGFCLPRHPMESPR